MTLPPIHKHDLQHWTKLHNAASTEDGKAIVGALMLVAIELEQLLEAVQQLRDPPPQNDER